METNRKSNLVAYWLLLGVAMIVIQVLLGGITRLTGSGLSITEWKPILGAIPPMNDQDWNAAFEMYRQKASGQFIYQNSDFTLSDFKAIYFWEWFHREWARLLGVVFLIGFVYFLWKKYFSREMVTPFIVLFILGALQGAIGWIMVMSGLNPDDTHVSHIKLALHFIAALILLCYVLWFALKLLVPEGKRPEHKILRTWAIAALVLLAIQLVYGAFMAGLKAAPAATTWPDVNGTYLPGDLSHYAGQSFSGGSIFTDHPIAIHYIHRTLAYILFIVTALYSLRARAYAVRNNLPLLRRFALWPFILCILQVCLGIFTVLNGNLMTQNKFGTFEILAESHQMVAILLLISLVINFYLVKRRAGV